MNTIGKRLRLPAAALALGLGLSGCAPAFGGASFGPGLGLGLSLGGSPQLNLGSPSCLTYGAPTARAAALQVNAAAIARSRMAQIAAIESRYRVNNLMAPLAPTANWKRVAEGGC